MESLPAIVEFALVLGVGAACLQLWAMTFWSGRAPWEIVPTPPRPLAAWGLVDVLLVAVLMFALQFAALGLAFGFEKLATFKTEDLTLAGQSLVFLAVSLGSLTTVVVGIAVVYLRSGASPTQQGFSGLGGRAIGLGGAGFLMCMPPVMAMQAVLVHFFPSSHPLLDLLKQEANGQFAAVSFLAAVVAAPLLEEYLFRGLIQGWLENWVGHPTQADVIVFGPGRKRGSPASAGTQTPAASAGEQGPTATPQPAVSDAPITETPSSSSAPANPYAPPLADQAAKMVQAAAVTNNTIRRPWLPVVITSVLFALMHYSHGPDPIPLFFLSLGLGYLYRQSNSIWPSVIMHALFNAWSLLLLFLSLWLGL